MPVNRSWDLAALKQALLALPLPPTRRLLIGYVLIAGVNDSPAQAEALAHWISGLRALVNLIPLNPIPGNHQRPASQAARDLFRDRLLAAGVEVRLRATKGDGVMAACGQLGTARPRPPAPQN
jgi:23S rRNA (adenine2503-C2)-methyltransferase